jgi:hypothetical protein
VEAAARGWEAPGLSGRREEGEEEEEGVGEARREQEAMNGDRTESDWQGLVSEVRPGAGGDARGPRGNAADGRGHPPGAAPPHPGGHRAPLSPAPAGGSRGEEPERSEQPRDPGWEAARPHLALGHQVTTVLEASDWTPGAETERGNPGPVVTPGPGVSDEAVRVPAAGHPFTCSIHWTLVHCAYCVSGGRAALERSEAGAEVSGFVDTGSTVPLI